MDGCCSASIYAVAREMGWGNEGGEQVVNNCKDWVELKGGYKIWWIKRKIINFLKHIPNFLNISYLFINVRATSNYQ